MAVVFGVISAWALAHGIPTILLLWIIAAPSYRVLDQSGRGVGWLGILFGVMFILALLRSVTTFHKVATANDGFMSPPLIPQLPHLTRERLITDPQLIAIAALLLLVWVVAMAFVARSTARREGHA